MTFSIIERGLADYHQELNALIDEIQQMAPYYRVTNPDSRLTPGRINFATTLCLYNPRVDWIEHGEDEPLIEALASGFKRKEYYSVDFSINSGASAMLEPLEFRILHNAQPDEQEDLLKSAFAQGIQYFKEHRNFMIDALNEDGFIP